LILVGEEEILLDFSAAVEPFDGEVIETTLDEEGHKSVEKGA